MRPRYIGFLYLTLAHVFCSGIEHLLTALLLKSYPATCYYRQQPNIRDDRQVLPWRHASYPCSFERLYLPPCSSIATHTADRAKCRVVMEGTQRELDINVPEVTSSDFVLHTASFWLTVAPWQQSHLTGSMLSYSTTALKGKSYVFYCTMQPCREIDICPWKHQKFNLELGSLMKRKEFV